MKTQNTTTPAIDEATNLEGTRIPADESHRLRSINPADRTVIGEAKLTSPAEATELCERMRQAQRAWRRRPLSRRVRRARSIFWEVLEWRRELLELVVDETGKNTLEARMELWATCREVTEMLAEADSMLSADTEGRWWTPGRRVETNWSPRGVVLVIASGFEPVHTALAPALAAIIAGNAVVVVGDETAPLVVESLANIANATAIPDGLCYGVVGEKRLIDNLADRSDAIVSYGSSALTRRLARRQGDRLVPVMGRWKTRDVMIVLNDADIDRAARGAVYGSCGGAGRNRRSLRRIYVQESAVDEFVDAVVEQLGGLQPTSPDRDDEFAVGPLADREQLETMEELVDDAARSGARLVAGGRARPRCRGTYFEPTVLTGVDESMRLWQEGTPGPVVAVAPVHAPAEAVRRTRDVDGYGAVSIYTSNRNVARNMANDLRVPVVGINDVVDELPPASAPVCATAGGPIDPIGADRLRALSTRRLEIEGGWTPVAEVLRSRAPQRMEKTLQTAISAVHRRGWIQNAVDAVVPGR